MNKAFSQIIESLHKVVKPLTIMDQLDAQGQVYTLDWRRGSISHYQWDIICHSIFHIILITNNKNCFLDFCK